MQNQKSKSKTKNKIKINSFVPQRRGLAQHRPSPLLPLDLRWQTVGNHFFFLIASILVFAMSGYWLLVISYNAMSGQIIQVAICEWGWSDAWHSRRPPKWGQIWFRGEWKKSWKLVDKRWGKAFVDMLLVMTKILHLVLCFHVASSSKVLLFQQQKIHNTGFRWVASGTQMETRGRSWQWGRHSTLPPRWKWK